MELIEYIKSQLPQEPNTQIMYDMGASDELVEYIKYTPWNTNLNVIESLNKKSNNSFKLIPMELDDETVLAHKLTEEEYIYFFNPPIGKICNVTYSGTFKKLQYPIDGPFIETINEDSFEMCRYPPSEIDDYNYSSILQTFNFLYNEINNNKYLIARGANASNGDYQTFFSEDDITINYQIKDGNKIYITLMEGEVIERINVPLGESWAVNRQFSLTDGTNTYSSGEIITPTQDIYLEPA